MIRQILCTQSLMKEEQKSWKSDILCAPMVHAKRETTAQNERIKSECVAQRLHIKIFQEKKSKIWIFIMDRKMQIHTKQRLAKTSINKRLSNIQNMFNFREKMRHRKLKKKKKKKNSAGFCRRLKPTARNDWLYTRHKGKYIPFWGVRIKKP